MESAQQVLDSNPQYYKKVCIWTQNYVWYIIFRWKFGFASTLTQWL